MKNPLGFLFEYSMAFVIVPMALGITLGLLANMSWEVSFYLGCLGLLCHFWASRAEISVTKDYMTLADYLGIKKDDK